MTPVIYSSVAVNMIQSSLMKNGVMKRVEEWNNARKNKGDSQSVNHQSVCLCVQKHIHERTLPHVAINPSQ